MKTYFATLVLVATLVSAVAAGVGSFTNWDDLIDGSPDIIIAKCTVVTHPTVVFDNIIPCDIDVIATLKGATKPGPSMLQSTYRSHEGDEYLIFANNYASNQYFKGYNAIEGYRIIALDEFFNTNTLSGKSLREQIRMILQYRLDNLNHEIKAREDEKKRLEEGFKTPSVP